MKFLINSINILNSIFNFTTFLKSNLVFPVQAVLQRKKYEDKYDVDVFDDPQTGQTSVKDRQKDEVIYLLKP